MNQDKTLSESRTVIEDRSLEKQPLSPAISTFRDYQIVSQMKTGGSEADIYIIQKENQKRVLKLYRYGSDPPVEVLEKVRELSSSCPENVVFVEDSGFDDQHSRFFEIMEYLEGGSLYDLCRDFPLKENNQIISVLAELNRGLKFLHDNQLLHLDLKPSNILIRSAEPLKLVFSDFGISSVIDQEISRKMTVKLKGTPLYWSPEAFTQVVGKESDFWSMGMIILELLTGNHPFQSLDMRVIMYTLSTKGVKIPDKISEDWALLLKGLLTRDPRKRFGYNEVSRWLEGERNIPLAYDFRDSPGRMSHCFSFMSEDYYSLEELLQVFISDENCWAQAREHCIRGHISEWLNKNGEYEKSLQVESVVRNNRNNPEAALMHLAHIFLRGSGFIIWGKLITFQNIFLYATKYLKKEATTGESAVVRLAVTGNLLELYQSYLKIYGKEVEKDDFVRLLGVLKFNVPKMTMEQSLQQILIIFDFWWNTADYFFPQNTGIQGKLLFIRKYGDRIIRKKHIEETMQSFMLPLELIEQLNSRSLETVAEAAMLFNKWKTEGSLVRFSPEKEQISEIAEYLRLARDNRLHIDPAASKKISWIQKKFPRPVLRKTELELLENYLFAMQNGEISWKKTDSEIIGRLYSEVMRIYGLNHILFSVITGLVFSAVFGGTELLLLALVGGLGEYLYDQPARVIYTLNLYFGLLAIGAGLITAMLMGFEAGPEQKLQEIQRGFIIGSVSVLILQFFFHTGYYYFSFAGIMLFGALLGTGLIPVIRIYQREKKTAEIYENYQKRINDVTQNIIEVKE